MPANAMYSLTTRVGHVGKLLRDQLLQLGAADGAADRQAAPVGFRAIFRVVHQPQVGLAQDFEPVRGNARRAEQRQPDLARRGDEAEQRPRIGVA